VRDLPRDQRDEIEQDLAERLRDGGVTTHADAVAALGDEASYVAELRAAMELPSIASVRRRRLARAIAVAVVLLLTGFGIWYVQRREAVPADYPLVFSSSGLSGAGEMAGSAVIMPQRLGEAVIISVVVSNEGDRTVSVDSVGAVNGVAGDQASLSVGPGLPPLWVPAVKVFPQEDANGTVFLDFDDPSGQELPVTLAPGKVILLSLRGERAYCVDNEGAINEHIVLETTIDGERRTFTGNELVFRLDGCS
jgi:hypothetical protein